MKDTSIAILGAGNIGIAIARGLHECGRFDPARIILTRRKSDALTPLQELGFQTGNDNLAAVAASDVIIVAVEPGQIVPLLEQIGPALEPGRHLLVSVVSAVDIAQIRALTRPGIDVVRAMPNTAVAIRESMTCLASDGGNGKAMETTVAIFEAVGRTLVIDEEQMASATALGACGVAFFLRAIRAASQGGIEIGFHSEEAMSIAAQTARGAASLLLARHNHPEYEIDRVTTPRGCTIAGLNQMEHDGFSSAMIKGITTSARKAGGLYKPEGD